VPTELPGRVPATRTRPSQRCSGSLRNGITIPDGSRSTSSRGSVRAQVSGAGMMRSPHLPTPAPEVTGAVADARGVGTLEPPGPPGRSLSAPVAQQRPVAVTQATEEQAAPAPAGFAEGDHPPTGPHAIEGHRPAGELGTVEPHGLAVEPAAGEAHVRPTEPRAVEA